MFTGNIKIKLFEFDEQHSNLVYKCRNKLSSDVVLYIPFNSQGHIGIGPQHWHLWGFNNPHRGDIL